MTETKIIMDKKEPSSFQKNRDNMKNKKENKVHSKKIKQMMKKRLIVRNLSFQVSVDELKKIFSAFGEVLDVKIPVNEAGKKRGFAFVLYKDTKSQIKAMKNLNFKKIHGRPIAIDFCVDKTTYQSNKNNVTSSVPSKKIMLNESASNEDSEDSEHEDVKTNTGPKTNCNNNAADTIENEEDKKIKDFLKEFDGDEELPDNAEDESSDESSDETDDENESYKDKEDDSSTRSQQFKKKRSEDVSEGKTVFVRNISFKNSEEDLQEIVQEYGDIEYCLFCIDPLTDQFKGTAFVKFKEKENADKFIQGSYQEPGILLDGRKLMCAYALSREDVLKQHEGSDKVKDRRNLRLLKCGLILNGSKEAEGVSQADMTKRAQLEIVKKQKLKNVNFFVSDKRLIIHNLPKNINDRDLYALFKKAAGKGAVIKEARVMRDFKKTDALGSPMSRGFGFISFTEHEHALKALMELNNNPKILTSNKRPIVEFSVENKVALLSQAKRKEKMKMRNKRKLEGHTTLQSEEQEPPISFKRKKIKNKGNEVSFKKNMKKNTTDNKSPSYGVMQETKSKKKQKKRSKGKIGKKAIINAQEKSNLSVLTNKYKEKLINKFF